MSVYNKNNILDATNKFRTILDTTKNSQSTLMYLEPNQNIGMEIHKNTDQYVYILEGNGVAILNGAEYDLSTNENFFVIINAGVEHDIIANDCGLKLMVIYTTILH